MSTEFFWIAVAVVTVVSASRLTRLLTYDVFPPVQWVRDRLDERVNDTKLSSWGLLWHCQYCMAPWMALLVLSTGVASDFHVAWWFINGWLAAGYAAAIFMAHDGEE